MKLRVLGSAQDAGVPQLGCTCANCAAARADGKKRRLAPSVAVCGSGSCYFIDASLDLRQQYDEMMMVHGGGGGLSGILLTHAHIGHCGGLVYFGRESMNTERMPVYCTKKMAGFISENYPFDVLVQRGNIVLHELEPGVERGFEGFFVTPFFVPHRRDTADTDTVGFRIVGKRTVVYIPDMDYYTDEIIEEIKKAGVNPNRTMKPALGNPHTIPAEMIRISSRVDIVQRDERLATFRDSTVC